MSTTSEFQSISLEGRRPGPRLLVIAGVHGDEFEPMVAVRRLAEAVLSDDLSGTITLVPVANESALARTSRCGEDGLDLARTFPGKAHGTRTERVAAELNELIRNATHMIDLHTGGVALRLVPLCGYMLHADSAVLATQREMAIAFGLPYVWGTSAALEGRSLSAARDANVPAVYVEIGGGSTFDSKAVDAMVEGCMRVARAIGMLGASNDARTSPCVVEDNRPASGHLQVQNAAPMAGLFIACVELGDQVIAGTVIGEIHSPITAERATVRSDSAGAVFMLREVAAVKAGDALAAIVDTGAST